MVSVQPSQQIQTTCQTSCSQQNWCSLQTDCDSRVLGPVGDTNMTVYVSVERDSWQEAWVRSLSQSYEIVIKPWHWWTMDRWTVLLFSLKKLKKVTNLKDIYLFIHLMAMCMHCTSGEVAEGRRWYQPPQTRYGGGVWVAMHVLGPEPDPLEDK